MSRNYVLIILDCVRKDFFDEHATNIKNLSDVSFNQCRSASSWSPPSHGSIFTGELPYKHGIHTYQKSFNSLSASDTFFSYLPKHKKLAVNANVILDAHEFGSLFDDYTEEIWLYENQLLYDKDTLSPRLWSDPDNSSNLRKSMSYIQDSIKSENTIKSLLNGIYHTILFDKIHKLPIPKLTDDGASKQINSSINKIRRTEEPFFLFNNFLDVHWEYQNLLAYDQTLHNVSNTWKSAQSDDWTIQVSQDTDGYEQYIQNRRQLYAAAIDYLDKKVAEYIETVDNITDGETTFIVSSDHGENLAYPDEDYMIHHKSSMSESLLHVPFEIVNPPSGYATNEDELFSQLDIGKLIQGFERGETPDVFRQQVPAERIGTISYNSFLDIINRFELPVKSIEEKHDYIDRIIRCVYNGEDKYEWDSCGNKIKYEIDFNSPCTQTLINEGVDLPLFATDMFDIDIDEIKNVTRQQNITENIDPETQERLQKLGYI